MVARSTSLLRNQAGTSEIRTYRGIPELKPKKMQVSIFRVNRISVQLRCASAKRKLPLRARAEEERGRAREARAKTEPPGSLCRRHRPLIAAKAPRVSPLPLRERVPSSEVARRVRVQSAVPLTRRKPRYARLS